MRCKYGVSIRIEREAFNGVRYVDEFSGVGYGDNGSLSDVIARAKARADSWTLRAFEVRAVFEVYEHCEVCKVTGIKPGCKRKKCPACFGMGRAPSVTLPNACPHWEDNQGLCHGCGVLLNSYAWELFAGKGAPLPGGQ